ncbi:MAG: serine/threonine-protein kinase [Cyanobacteriota bacterium]|nr:serine/threonine-protein kinase [Cyanobacteriota bacterium]
MSQRVSGEIIGNRYQLTERISAGGMGEVFKGVDTQLFQRTVAIKVLHQNLAGDDKTQRQLRRRFEDEARLSTLLGEHPLIIKILDYGLDDHQPYLVMEYLAGSSLGELMLKHHAMDPRHAVHITRQICAGLHHAHSFETSFDDLTIKGVIHRDIKPSNIMVIHDKTIGETVKILDFGIAKVISDASMALGTQTTGFLGTTRYASPEQLRGEELDSRSDIYSLGCVLYRMLAGEMPITPNTDTFQGWYQSHNYQPARPFARDQLPHTIPKALEEVVLACLEKDPAQRPQTMQILGSALEAALYTPGSSLAPLRTHQIIRSTDGLAGSPTSGSVYTAEAEIFSGNTLAQLDAEAVATAKTQHLTALPAGTDNQAPPLWQKFWPIGLLALLILTVAGVGLRFLVSPGEEDSLPPLPASPLPSGEATPVAPGELDLLPPEPILDFTPPPAPQSTSPPPVATPVAPAKPATPPPQATPRPTPPPPKPATPPPAVSQPLFPQQAAPQPTRPPVQAVPTPNRGQTLQELKERARDSRN